MLLMVFPGFILSVFPTYGRNCVHGHIFDVDGVHVGIWSLARASKIRLKFTRFPPNPPAQH